MLQVKPQRRAAEAWSNLGGNRMRSYRFLKVFLGVLSSGHMTCKRLWRSACKATGRRPIVKNSADVFESRWKGIIFVRTCEIER